MKSVQIITRHFIPNYGSLLQSVASVKIFEELGYQSQIIDYIPKTESILGNTTAYACNFSKNFLKRAAFWILKLPDQCIKALRFRGLRKHYVKQTKRFSSLKALTAYDFKNDYLCSGSDQLWGFVNDEKSIDPAYFLEFAKPESVCFAYSSSFGRTDFNEEYYKRLNEYLKKFSFITVREQSGVELIEMQTPYSAEHVLDPTLTVSREFWLDFANKPIKRKPYLLIYHLRRNKNLENYAAKLAKKNGWQILRVSTSIYDLIKQGKTQLLKDPKTVLSLFKNAECVVTDSFHATVFSLIFNRQFINVLPAKTHERITDLLDLVGVQERAFPHDGEISLDAATKPIDYERVNAVLANAREHSLTVLKNNLEKLEQ